MKLGVALLNFGEPESAIEGEVIPFLERIFSMNAALESTASADEIRARSHELAVRRAPGLIAEYEEIGGSPLNRQAAEQAAALEQELRRRGHDARTYVGMQFTEPSMRAAVASARAAGIEQFVALPVYPLCGASTTVAALSDLRREIDALQWQVELFEIAGWHRHPSYIELRADGIRATASAAGLDLNGSAAKLVFSAHGTPVKYLREGNRYDRYVEEHCAAVARAAGVNHYLLGYQNHTNRPIEWTQPDIEAVVREAAAEALVVVPISFMHEQSETLAELDHELRELAETAGRAFHRVPVPHDDPRFAAILADLVEARMGTRDGLQLRRCSCRKDPLTYCTNSD
jgi:ferrochelatase